MKIRFKLLSKCEYKLQVIKLIKDCTDLDLRDSKDLVDEMFNNIGLTKEIVLREPYIREGEMFNTYKEFSSKIKDLGDFCVTGGISWERDLKMLSLGIGELGDYSQFISEYIKFSDIEENKELLESLFNKLKKEDLVELVNKIKI